MTDDPTLKHYYLNARAEMRGFVPPNATRILEVGCGGGAFMAGLRATRPDVQWAVGIELVADAAENARKHFDEVACAGAEDGLQQVEGPFDAVVLNDVLEHLVDPWAVLRQIRPLLSPGHGRLVVSLPNVQHWDTAAALLFQGRWDYADAGVLDRTHLRFFTRSSLVDLFEPNGYRIERCEGICPGFAWRGRLLNALSGGRFSDCRYRQFACVATPV